MIQYPRDLKTGRWEKHRVHENHRRQTFDQGLLLGHIFFEYGNEKSIIKTFQNQKKYILRPTTDTLSNSPSPSSMWGNGLS